MIPFNSLAMVFSMIWTLNVVFMPLFVTKGSDISAFKIGFLVSLASIASLVFSPVSGHLSDTLLRRTGSRGLIIIIGAIAAVIFLIVLPELTAYIHIVIIAFLLFAVAASMETSFYAYIPEIISKSKLGREASILAFARLTGSAIVVIIGSLTWKKNHACIFYIIACSMLILSAITLSAVKRHIRIRKESVESIKNKKEIINFYKAQFFWNFAMAGIIPFLLVYLKTKYNLEIGCLYKWVPFLAAGGALIVLFSGFSIDMWGHRKTLALGVMLLAVFMPLNLIGADIKTVIFFLLLTAVPVIIIFSQAPAYLSHIIPAGREGKFFGYDTFSITLAQISGAWLSGIMIDRFGYPAMFCLAGIASAISFVFISRNPWKNLKNNL